jgi:hypothetical protein
MGVPGWMYLVHLEDRRGETRDVTYNDVSWQTVKVGDEFDEEGRRWVVTDTRAGTDPDSPIELWAKPAE